jgi:hypothetical protein
LTSNSVKLIPKAVELIPLPVKVAARAVKLASNLVKMIAKVVEIIANSVKLAPGLVELIFSRQIAVSFKDLFITQLVARVTRVTTISRPPAAFIDIRYLP